MCVSFIHRDAPPLIPTDTQQGYKQMKAKIGQSRVRPWKWMPFTNPARKVNHNIGISQLLSWMVISMFEISWCTNGVMCETLFLTLKD